MHVRTFQDGSWTYSVVIVSSKSCCWLLPAGNGDSEGTFRFANYWGEVAEMHAAKQHLQQHEGQTVIGLLGECRCKACSGVRYFADVAAQSKPNFGCKAAVDSAKCCAEWKAVGWVQLGGMHLRAADVALCIAAQQSTAGQNTVKLCAPAFDCLEHAYRTRLIAAVVCF
jgi:hypothetical protein